MTEPIREELSPIKRALVEIRELRARVAQLEQARTEPIAIVGMSIRAPGGVDDVAGFEQLLWRGVDAIGPIPPQRWNLDEWYDASPDAPGKMTTRFGGFVDGVDQFDAEFFGISPLEAASMDPQQRLVLELAWRALEDAAIAPGTLAGSSAGVYLGIANGDYGRALFARPELIDPYFSPGNAYSVASGRLAYLLGLHGPAISIDTACSSSLVALHLACQGLRQGDCRLALVGGVSLILTPELNVNFSKAGMMAADGRCKTFDANADGYVRGEGGAMLVLRRLSEATADGDRILAVIRGSAINQDGRSNGLTAPNGPAQEAVLRAALAHAGVAPARVGYLECHGTGTSLGDPIEVNAIGAVLGEGRRADQALAIGSVKTNIGHLEAAAGVAGVVKAVLALQRGEIPPHLHLRTPNPHIDWSALPLVVPAHAQDWPAIEGPRIAGVSAFGFSGTNAHVVLEQAPPGENLPGVPERPLHLLALSARDATALRDLVARYRTLLAGTSDDRIADLCHSANAGRAHFAARVAAQGATSAELDATLADWERGAANPALASAQAAPDGPRVAFLFPGQGPQYVDMGRALYETAPAFRDAFDRCCAALDALLPRPLREVVFPAAGAESALHETAYAQPAMFAIEIALAALWRSWGIEPVAVMGHSFGEYAAACVAGAVRLEDAARMVAARGRLAQALPRDGAMTVVEAAEDEVLAAIAAQTGRVAIAAVNGPTNTVLSGERAAVDALAATFAARGARVKPLRVSHAFHSPLMDPILDTFERELEGIAYSAPQLALVSNLSGRLADLATIGTPGYWRRHLREPVRFADAVHTLAAQGITHFVEMSPHPVLLGMASELVEGGQWLASLREGRPDWPVLFESLQQLYVDGASVDWRALDRGHARRHLTVPGYPFRRRRHWIDTAMRASTATMDAAERWERLEDAMRRQSQRAPLGLDPGSYPAKWACLARLTTAHAVATLRDAGLFTTDSERHRADEVLRCAGIADTYRHLLQRWLLGLVQRGLLRRDGDDFVADRALPDPALGALWSEAESLFADNRPLLDYVRHCGALVSAVLRGRESPLETLFPGGSFELAERLYERSSAMLYMNQLAATAFEALAASTGGTLRVLEVGAGTGGTTSTLLRVLPARRRRYRFTDVSEAFLDRARTRFAGQPGLEFGLFDLDADPAAQGYAAGSFDAIVAANAVHAVKDLRSALRRLAGLLVPGGLLVLIESTVHLDYFDMTTGLIEGWQHFADDLRGENPLLPPQTWLEALRDAGFDSAGAWPEEGSPAEALAQHVIVARIPGDALGAARVDTNTAEADGNSPSAPPSGADGADRAAADALRARCIAAPAAERLELLRELVRDQVAQVLRLPADAPPARHDRLLDLGLDSLMAVQLRNRLTRALGLERPLASTLVFDHPTIDAIAAHLSERFAPAAAPAAPEPAAADLPALDAAAVAALSDADIARLLDERLGAP